MGEMLNDLSAEQLGSLYSEPKVVQLVVVAEVIKGASPTEHQLNYFGFLILI